MQSEEEMYKDGRSGKKIWLLVLLIFLILWSVKEIFFPNPNADDAAGYVMPGTLSRDFNGTDMWQYYIYFFENRFGGYPWVVKISYELVVFSVLIWMFVFIRLLLFVQKKHEHKKIYQKLLKKYHDRLSEVMLSKEDLSMVAVIKILNLKRRTYTDETLRLWFKLFRALHVEYHDQININNRTKAAQVIGLMDYAVAILSNGTLKEKIRLLRSIRQLRLPVPDSLMAQLVNDKNIPLRKSARLYYSQTNREDPYVVMDEGFFDKNFCMWDTVEVHRALNRCYTEKKKMPSFLPLINNNENPFVKGFLITECGYWGTDEEMEGLMEYFDSENQDLKKAAYKSMGIHHFVAAEERIMSHYIDENGEIRRAIMESIFEIHSGQAADFFREAYTLAVADHTKRTALKCLWQYNELSKQYFLELKSQASTDEHILFQHVETQVDVDGDTEIK